MKLLYNKIIIDKIRGVLCQSGNLQKIMMEKL